MHPLEKAEKILRGIWPKNGAWIYESPDKGKTVYRRLSTLKPRQMIWAEGKRVACDATLDKQYIEILERGNYD